MLLFPKLLKKANESNKMSVQTTEYIANDMNLYREFLRVHLLEDCTF